MAPEGRPRRIFPRSGAMCDTSRAEARPGGGRHAPACVVQGSEPSAGEAGESKWARRSMS